MKLYHKEYKMADRIIMKLPQDVFMHILLRLPVKLLLRFRCVSKSCYTLIQSSTFINIHLHRTTSSEDEYILFKRSFKEDVESYKGIFSFFSSHNDDGNLNSIFPDLDVPNMTSLYSIDYDKIIGPCHGLIAVMDSRSTILFNPSTRKYRLLPSSPFGIPKGYYRSIDSGGFGFDYVVNDYKVFRISDVYTEDRYGYPEEGERKVEVYEVGIDIWRELDHVDQDLPRLFWLTSSMYYNGAYHWITTLNHEDKLIILCFDMSTEIFRNINTPDTRQFSSGTCHSLMLLDECLSFMCHPYLGPEIDPTTDSIDIWMMKDYNVYESWTKKYTIRVLSIDESPLAVWKDSLLFFQGKSGYLMSYDFKSEEVKEWNLHGCQKSMRAIVYQESLVAIPRGSQSSTELQNM
uniref:S-locus linked F-box protein type-4 n=1 Tax=Petunia axillaris subsp. axillaris TaxID=55889 RepID=E2RZH5_PETAX|nr:S-locus linked F-box protein type-4 [Petunia axillaris subsp. axillaris]